MENKYDISKNFNLELINEATEEWKTEMMEIYRLGLIVKRMFEDEEVFVEPNFQADEPSGLCIDGVIPYLNKEEQDCIIKIYNKYRGDKNESK